MSHTNTQTGTSDSDGYIHEVRFTQGLLERFTRYVPRALCGASLVAGPDEPELGSNALRCPKCASIR